MSKAKEILDLLEQDDGSKVKCQKCGFLVNHSEESEIAMGAIKCPKCGAVMNQEGKILRGDNA